MSLFKVVNDITQNFFGETCTYVVSVSESIELKAVFETQWIEVNGTSSQALTCQIKASDLTSEPQKGHSIIRGAKTYKVDVSQPNSDVSIFTLILKG